MKRSICHYCKKTFLCYQSFFFNTNLPKFYVYLALLWAVKWPDHLKKNICILVKVDSKKIFFWWYNKNPFPAFWCQKFYLLLCIFTTFFTNYSILSCTFFTYVYLTFYTNFVCFIDLTRSPLRRSSNCIIYCFWWALFAYLILLLIFGPKFLCLIKIKTFVLIFFLSHFYI